jgi:hypothetical protein
MAPAFVSCRLCVSVGAASVGAHILSTSIASQNKLFSAALMESGGISDWTAQTYDIAATRLLEARRPTAVFSHWLHTHTLTFAAGEQRGLSHFKRRANDGVLTGTDHGPN